MTNDSLRRELLAIRDDLRRIRPSKADREAVEDVVRRIEAVVEEYAPAGMADEDAKTHSIMEWWGVGKEFWGQMDVDDYIRKERDSWR